MNTGFYKDLDTNFEQACYLCEKSFAHKELIEMLKNGNIPEKQIAALKLETINSKEEAKILVDNLTGCDGKIREAVALKIYNLILNFPDKKNFFVVSFAKIFADATVDINANICRLVVDSVNMLKDNQEFSAKYVAYIINYAVQALDELDKFIFKDKKYVINKQLFKLYWCLESLKNFYDNADDKELFAILKRSAKNDEYTIREKTAEIAVLSHKFDDIKDFLKNDTNYYVKTALNH